MAKKEDPEEVTDLDLDPEEEIEDDEDRGDFIEEDEEDAEEELQDGEEEDEDPEEENEEDVDEEDEEPEERQEPRIPKSRLDEVIAQRNEERERNKYYEEQLRQAMSLLNQQLGKDTDNKNTKKVPTQEELDDLEAKYAEAAFIGDEKEAAKIRRQIRTAERDIIKSELEEVVSKASETAKSEARKIDDQTKFDQLITKYETDYPQLNQESPDFDEKLTRQVNHYMEKFMKAGDANHVALKDAVEIVMVNQPKAGNKPALGNKRKRSAVKRNTSAAKRQPSRMKGKSTSTREVNELDITKMSDKDFRSLTKAQKAKLRGD